MIDDNTRFGGFWLRFVAVLIDTLVLMVPLILISLIIQAPFQGAGEVAEATAALVDILGTVVLIWLYYALMHSSGKQATVGKMALGMKVVDIDGKRLSFWHATGRHFAEILSGIILLIGYFMVGWTHRKRGLHDIIASTYVIKVAHAVEKSEAPEAGVGAGVAA